MRASFTNRALGVGGDANTTSVTVRLPDPVVEFMDSHFDGRIKNRSEFLQHWAQVGVRVSLSDELTEALDWALQEAEKPQEAAVEDVAAPESIAEWYKPMDEIDWHKPDPVVSEGLQHIVYPDALTTGNHWKDRYQQKMAEGLPDELQEIREAQLEALRSRVK